MGATGVLVLFLVATLRPVIAVPEHTGAFQQVAALAATSTRNDITLIRGGSPSYVDARDASDVLALPLVAIHGHAVFGIRSQYPDNYARDLATLYTGWMRQGRHVYFLLGANGALWIPGMSFVKQTPFTFVVPEFSQLLNQKPASVGQLTITYQRYELVAGQLPLPQRIDVSDTASQVAGFYTQETIKGRTFAWTNGTGVLRFDAATQPRTLHLTVSAGTRPSTIGAATLCVDVAPQHIPAQDATSPWQEVTCVSLADDAVHDIAVTIPAITTSDATATGAVLVKLRSQPWIAADVDPRQNDRRPLGVQFVAAAMTTP
jgi:hypothetical protein